MMSTADLKILFHLMLKPIRGRTYRERLESFYAGQAENYDAFRDRLLPGRRELWDSIEVPEQGVWVDLGGGTASNLEFLGEKLGRLRKIVVVDLSPSLLAVSRQRIQRHGWTNVELVEADATSYALSNDQADVVTFSYSLTMIPDWFAAIENARRLLRPGGRIGVVDFYVSRKYPAEGMAGHSWLSRSFWPLWFGCDNVFLSPDHLPGLQRMFQQVSLCESREKVPYLPGLRVPYYQFLGHKAH